MFTGGRVQRHFPCTSTRRLACGLRRIPARRAMTTRSTAMQKADSPLRMTEEADREQLLEYDTSALQPQGVLLGLGGFARAHLCWLLHRIACGGGTACGITAVAMVEPDLPVLHGMQRQGNQYVHVRRATDGGVEAEAVGTICSSLYAQEQAEAVTDRIADPNTLFVATVITEGSYAVSFADGSEAAESVRSGDVLSSWYGLLICGLRKRYKAGAPPCAVIAMDNVPDNGHVIMRALKRCAELRYGGDRQFAEWIASVPTPCTMVDRITPAFRAGASPPHPLVTDVFERYNVEDSVPVQCERTLYWVIEDLPGPHADLIRRIQAAVSDQSDEVHVMLVPDVKPYEQAKAGLLNGQHVPLGLIGAVLYGSPEVSEAMRNDALKQYLQAYQAEVMPALASEPQEFLDFLDGFASQLHERFANPYLPDTCARLCAYTSDRFLNFIHPYICTNTEASRPVTCLAAATVVWAVHAADSENQSSEVEWAQQADGRKDALQKQARAEICNGTVGAFLQYADLLPADDSFVSKMQELHGNERFRREYDELVSIVRGAQTVQAGVHALLKKAAT